MMARAGVNCYARDDDELSRMLREVTRPGPDARRARRHRAPPVRRRSRRRRRGAGRDRSPHRPQGPRRRVAGAARPTHRDDRGGERARALRRAHAGRPGGVGDRGRRGQAAEERQPHRVRRGPPRPRRTHRPRRCSTQIRDMGVSVVVDAQAATHRSVELERLADQGVDIANGGWGKGSFLRWNRARNDVSKAGKVIAQEAGRPDPRVLSRSPPRRVRPVLLASCRSRSWSSPTSPSARRACPHGLAARARSTCSTVATATRRPWRSRWPTSTRSSSRPGSVPRRSGNSAEPVAARRSPRRRRGPRRCGGDRGRARRARRSVGCRRSVCASPPRSWAWARKGHVALTFDDGPDPESTPQFLDVLDALGWRATFFMLGEMTRRDPGVARDVAARRARGRCARRRARQHAPAHARPHRATTSAARYDSVAAATGRRAALVPAAVRHLVVRVVARRRDASA